MDGNSIVITANGNESGLAVLFTLPFHDTYCAGASNSTGQSAELEARGDSRVEIGDLSLLTRGLPAYSFSMLLASLDRDRVIQPGQSAGTLCLGAHIGRFIGDVAQATSDGQVNIKVIPLEFPDPALGPVAIQPGDTYHFQVWYRDAVAGATSNFSSAVAITFE